MRCILLPDLKKSSIKSVNLFHTSSEVIPNIPVLAVCLQTATSIALSKTHDLFRLHETGGKIHYFNLRTLMNKSPTIHLATKGVSRYSLMAFVRESFSIFLEP
jgi:hypothetical protein